MNASLAAHRNAPVRPAALAPGGEAQGSLWDPRLVGRSFAQRATTVRSGDAALRERLRELELRRRRAQIRARRVLDRQDSGNGAVERPMALPFAS